MNKKLLLLLFLAFMIPAQDVLAGCSLGRMNESRRLINEHTDEEFEAHQIWWVSVFWEDNMLPALMLMADQLTAVAVKQTEMVGGFMDAKHQMETQQSLQKIRATATKDYHPSVGMCVFGSTVKSLAASERQGEVNAVILAQRAMDRALGNANTVSASGAFEDTESRLKQFREVYCNPKDNGNGLLYMCQHDQTGAPVDSDIGRAAPNGIGGIDNLRLNKDIDFARTIDFPWTLDVNLVDGATEVTSDEQDVFALATNLYSNKVFARVNTDDLEDTGDTAITTMQAAYMDARAVLAKRSVAENSYNALVGMKSAGTAGSRDFLEALLEELGVTDTIAGAPTRVKVHVGDASGSPTGAVTYPSQELSPLDALLGENPSYYAQMEMITKKIYQNPNFYTNLYDKPANVERKGVALQAIGLMQKFDLLKSNLRNEATQSVLLELAVIDLQEEAEEELKRETKGGEGKNP